MVLMSGKGKLGRLGGLSIILSRAGGIYGVVLRVVGGRVWESIVITCSVLERGWTPSRP